MLISKYFFSIRKKIKKFNKKILKMIYIHIGLQKTGTTSLQYILEKINLLTHPLNKLRFTDGKEKEFYSAGNNKIFKYSKQKKLKKSYFEDKTNKNVIISCENFTNPYDKLRGLKNLLSFLTSNNLKFILICTLRDFDDFSKSLYIEQITNSKACEMRTFQSYKKSLKNHLNNLHNILSLYPTKIFHYDKNINQNIINFIDKEKTIDESLFYNFKNNTKSVAFDEIEKIAIKNRYLGWWPKYRKELRMNYKKNNINIPFSYSFITFLKSYKRLIFN